MIGLGYVGLPLATVIAEAGFKVIGIDTDSERVDAVNRGDSYNPDVPSETLRRLAPNSGGQQAASHQNGQLSATTDHSGLRDIDVAIICVPTPLDKNREPDLSYIVAAIKQVELYMHPGVLVILESTTYPGTTEELLLPYLNHSGGGQLEVGSDFFLAFSPERIDPGRTDWTLTSTPKLVGGITPHCLETAVALYEAIVDEVVPVSSPSVAEMAKLLENTFRATNIGLANEFALMCDRLGINVWEVIEAAKTKPFGFMPFYPGPGLGGHCVPVDPEYLAWKLNGLNYNPRFIQLASDINTSMPSYIVTRLADALNEFELALRGSKILVLGVAYKAAVSDFRDSPALELIRLLNAKGVAVSYHDPYVPSLDVDVIQMSSVELDTARLQDSDCVLIVTAHPDYDWQWIVDNTRLVFDTRNATKDVKSEPGRVVTL